MVILTILAIIERTWSVFLLTWWILIPVALWFVFVFHWRYHLLMWYLKKLDFKLLEVKFPKDIEKSVKAMEQVFTAIYGLYSFGFRFWQVWWEGHVLEDFVLFEIVGNGGTARFFIRVPDGHRNLVESAIYSQFPAAEITLIPPEEDYKKAFPQVLPDDNYTVWGTDYKLKRPDYFPLRSFEYFEGTAEEVRIDPIANLVEIMAGLKNDEAIWVQLICSPTGTDWTLEHEEFRDKLIGRPRPSAKRGSIAKGVEFIEKLFTGAFKVPEWMSEKGDEKVEANVQRLSPGERSMLEVIEKKTGKPAFETNLRWVYIDRRDSFTGHNVAALFGNFQLFNTLDLNALVPNKKTMTKTKGIGQTRELLYRKRRLYHNYVKTKWPRNAGKRMILNVEELATMWHFPTIVVQSPSLRPVDAKKGSPPPDLPVE